MAVTRLDPEPRASRWGPLGRALLDYHLGDREAALVVRSNLWEDETTPAEEFYRPDGARLPEIERRALQLCRGRILDLGAGAGRHALELQRLGFEVTAIDILPQAVRIMRDRGVRDARLGDLDAVSGEHFDTILLLMHGLGLVGTISGLLVFLERIRRVLADGGRILCDSADLGAVMPARAAEHRLNGHGYFGEVTFELHYGDLVGAPYPWLFADHRTLARSADAADFSCAAVARSDRGAYLARLEPFRV